MYINWESTGSCSKCGGDVCLPRAWMGVQKPRPTCTRCGAKAASSKVIIEMDPS